MHGSPGLVYGQVHSGCIHCRLAGELCHNIACIVLASVHIQCLRTGTAENFTLIRSMNYSNFSIGFLLTLQSRYSNTEADSKHLLSLSTDTVCLPHNFYAKVR